MPYHPGDETGPYPIKTEDLERLLKRISELEAELANLDTWPPDAKTCLKCKGKGYTLTKAPIQMKPRVMVESPFKDNDLARFYLSLAISDSLLRNEAPFAPHGFYTTYLDDMLPDDRRLGMECGHIWADSADLIAFYIDLGMSDGMSLMRERIRKYKEVITRKLSDEFQVPIHMFLTRVASNQYLSDPQYEHRMHMLMRAAAHAMHNRQTAFPANHLKMLLQRTPEFILPAKKIKYTMTWEPARI